ncbi:MAG: PKD domain-containing protein [Bacteroidales bacterium]|nr:PKD domain-containing protein [Bacteroidales bacterium]MCF8403339.1 PKD domain-containing protein [Bacteroidales bacterium]
MYLRLLKIIVLISILNIGTIQAQINTNNLEELFEKRGEVYFKVINLDLKGLATLSKTVSIDRPTSINEVYAYANKKEFQEFLDLGLEYEILTPPGLAHKVKMKSVVNLKQIEDWDFYPTYEAYIGMMNQFVTDYPDLCELVNIGYSNQNRELLCLKISDNISQNEGEAQFLYTSSIHGDETTGYVLMLRLIDYLLSNYGYDPQITNLVDNLEIWINPLANPDGTYAGGNNSVYGAVRYNSNWVDLNRNYPDPEDGPHPDGNAWQTETIAFMNFADANNFTVSANFHGGEEVCNYPWDTWPDLAADDAWWQYVCHEYADTAQAYSPNGYLNGFDDGITNGYAWYTISGGRQDYMNYFQQCREFTMEISDTKLLPANLLPDWWEYNYRSFLNYIEQTLFGVSGTITDAITGYPIAQAEVFIENHDIDSSMVYSNEHGKYYRPLITGTYDITFSANGYYPTTVENVSAVNKQLTIQDVQLTPGDLIVDFTASATNIPIGSNINFTDATFGNPISWEWSFEGATPSTSNQQNPSNIFYANEGSFDVSLTVSDGTNSQTITKEDYINVSVEFIMQNTTVTTCTGVFYDTGGPSANYGNNQNIQMTFLPEATNGMMVAEFTSFNVEFESSCDYDWLKIYDGVGTSSPLIGEYCGTNSPGTITATNESGALTFIFHSDASVTESGWSANIDCEIPVLPPLADFSADTTLTFVGGSIQFMDLSSNSPISWFWTFEGGTPSQSSAQNPSVIYETAGTYDVSLEVTNSAGTDSKTMADYITVESTTDIQNNNLNVSRVYPNPVSDMLIISSISIIDEIKVFSLLGAYKLSVEPDNQTAQLNLSGLAEGIYIIEVYSEQSIEFHKINIAR